ncbi:hypothetical protein DL95DRAFT_388600 [Leptodontidium sp. 2 PMI_412]|nr:hypothetical protein DL95DRAFT_388600 [Leptodontidium sp. 2 PMI_412]
MARADKSVAITVAVVAIQRGEVADYSAAAAKFKCDWTSISKRIRGLTRSRKNATTF